MSARRIAVSERVYLDTETTGLDALNDCVVSVAIIDDDANVLVDSLVDPQRAIPAAATHIHGIRDEDVAGAPRLSDLMPSIADAVRGRELVIYNAAYDLQFLPGVQAVAASVDCAMLRAMQAMDLNRWPRLSAAAEWAGHDWAGTRAHSALGDTLATRTIYRLSMIVLGLEGGRS